MFRYSIASRITRQGVVRQPTVTALSGGAIRRKGFLSNLLENVKKEASKDEELSKSVQKIEERLTDVKENAALKSIKESVAKAKEDFSQSNQAAIKEIKQTAAKLQEKTAKAGETLSTMAEPVRKLGQTIVEKTPIDIEKIAKNKTVQKAAETIVKAQETVIDETESYRYGGFMSKEKRDQLRASRNQGSDYVAAPTHEKIDENPE